MTATRARGSTARATLEFVRRAHGDDVEFRVLMALPATQRARLTTIDSRDELPYADVLALWHAVDAAVGAHDPQWIERSGAFSIESLGMQLYSGILRKRSPREFLTQSVSLFQLYYAPGDMEVVEEEADRAVLRLRGFDSEDRLFCRRQTGGLTGAIALAGGERPRVKHVRCTHEGDAFCEWELIWTAAESTPPASAHVRPQPSN
jgi:hypothetical protein